MVLIIDNDLGFVFWLGRALDRAGCTTVPATTIPDASWLILQFDLRIDVLLINTSLPAAGDFVRAIHRTQGDVKVVGIFDREPPGSMQIVGINTTRPKPAPIDENATTEWVNFVRELLGEPHGMRVAADSGV